MLMSHFLFTVFSNERNISAADLFRVNIPQRREHSTCVKSIKCAFLSISKRWKKNVLIVITTLKGHQIK